jgi:murein DD-endopeptidase MepM/ murein hydrolase activator NlpD
MSAWRLIVGFTIAAVLVVPSAVDPAAADPRGDKKRVDAQVARAAAILEGATARAQAAARRLATVAAALPGAQQRVAEARGEVAAATVTANTARRAADAAESVVGAATARYEESAARVEAARERVAGFVAASYKGADLVSLNVLLGSRTPQELIQRTGYVERVLDDERQSVDDLAASRREAKQAQNDAILAQRRADGAEAAARAALADARTAQGAAESAAAALAALATQRTAALAVAREERAASLARYRQAKIEAARVEAELRAWEARQRARHARGPVLRRGARFLMPVAGWKSSDFGWRYDPYYHVWQLHAGVDLAAGGGAPIFAAASGRVIRAGWNGGYGNFTCVSHGTYEGEGLSTCYAHQSRILVDPGQWVRAGQVIGRVGTTGASTGYHLHFEVRLDGRPVQPLGFLPDCLC